MRKKSSLTSQVERILLVIVALNCIKSSECYSNIDKVEPRVASHKLRHPQKQHIDSNAALYQQQQIESNAKEYDLSIKEQKLIDENMNEDQSRPVQPSKEMDGNSQLFFVNLTRVVNDGSNNKTEYTRLVGNDEHLIKQDERISCGETNRNGESDQPSISEPLQNRIVGGSKADPGEFPYQVRLNIRSRRGSSLCGGVIIDQRHMLTAAHCMTTW